MNKSISQSINQSLASLSITGGMVDDDEEVSLTLKREFGEEALNSIDATEEQRDALEAQLKEFFKHGTEIYKGDR